MKIGIDIDEVVVEFFREYLKDFNKKFNKNYEFEEWTHYNIWEFTDISKEESLGLADEFSKTKAFFETGLVEGAKQGISELEKENKIFFVTSRPIDIKERTIEFFKMHFPENNFEIHFSGEMWGGEKTKAEICEELGIKIIIEDNAHYALDCAEKGIKAFLLDKTWNKDYIRHENLTKVKDWKELMVHLNKILEEENGK
jgi:uncharacterized protein